MFSYCFDVFSYTFVLSNRHQPYCVLKRHYMTFKGKHLYLRNLLTVLPVVSIYVSTVMFFYLTMYF